MILLLLLVVLSLLIVHLSHQIHELGVAEERVLSQSACVLDVALELLRVVCLLALQLVLQLRDLYQVLVSLGQGSE